MNGIFALGKNVYVDIPSICFLFVLLFGCYFLSCLQFLLFFFLFLFVLISWTLSLSPVSLSLSLFLYLSLVCSEIVLKYPLYSWNVTLPCLLKGNIGIEIFPFIPLFSSSNLTYTNRWKNNKICLVSPQFFRKSLRCHWTILLIYIKCVTFLSLTFDT